MTPHPPDPLFPLLALACGVFLFANVGSFALVNIGLVLGLLTSLLHRPFRAGLLGKWPGRTGLGLLGLLGWVFLSQIASPESWVSGADLAYRTALRTALGLLLGFSLARVHPREGFLMDWVQRMAWLMVAFVIPALPSIREYRVSLYHSVYGREILGPNVLGGIFGTLLLFTLAEFLAGLPEKKGEPLLRMALLFVGVGLSGSRSCLLLVIVGCASFLLWNLSLGRLLKAAGLGGLLLVTLGLVNPRFVPGGYTTIGWELGVRGRIWGQAVSVIRLVPWFGCGARRYRDKLDEIGPDYVAMDSQGRPYGTDDVSLIKEGVDPLQQLITRNPLEAHNDYLTWAAQHGLPGLLGFVLFHLSLLAVARRAGLPDSGESEVARAHARAILAVVLGIGVYSLFNAVWFNKELGPMVYFFLGAALGTLRRSE